MTYALVAPTAAPLLHPHTPRCQVLHEKAAKRRLEQQIAEMERQLGADTLGAGGGGGAAGLGGGGGGGGSPAHLMQRQYESKLAELEKERECIEQEKEQVHRYKALLQKQRDIMIALTARLNERDETILAMQEEHDQKEACR